MKNIIRYILPVIFAVLLSSIDSFSQSRIEKTLDNMLLDAVDHFNCGEFAEAEKLLMDILTYDRSYDAAWYYMGRLSIIGEDLEGANTCFASAVALDPTNYWYRYKHAQINKFISVPLAIEMYEKLIEDFPKKSDLYWEMVGLYVSEERYENALETLKEIETIFGMTEELAIYTFRLYYTMDREAEGIDYLKEFNAKYSSPQVLTILADNEMAMYNDTLALKYYNEALELDSTLAAALSGKAEVYRVFRRYDEFFPALNRYVECEAAPVGDKVSYLNAIVEKSDPRFVRKYIDKLDSTMIRLSEVHPEDSLIYSLRGLFYYYIGKREDAKEQFHDCMLKYPGSYNAAAEYFQFLVAVGQWQDLSEESYKAFERFPNNIELLEMACAAEYNLANYNKVLEICRQVLQHVPDTSATALNAWSTIGDVYHILGDSKSAYKAYDNALKIDPDNIYVLNNYAYYLSVDGRDLKKAYQMSRKTILAEPENATYLDTYGWILYLRGEYLEAKSFFKQAMLYGGKESAVILDHYADVLYALKEYDLAVVYWNMALRINVNDEVPGLAEKVQQKKKEMKR